MTPLWEQILPQFSIVRIARLTTRLWASSAYAPSLTFCQSPDELPRLESPGSAFATGRFLTRPLHGSIERLADYSVSCCLTSQPGKGNFNHERITKNQRYTRPSSGFSVLGFFCIVGGTDAYAYEDADGKGRVGRHVD